MSETRVTLNAFIATHGIKLRSVWTDRNPVMEENAEYPMDHWRCTMRCGVRRMTITFSMGAAHHGKAPKLTEVLECLAGDAAGFENADGFEDWCRDYGYATDSRKAERIWKAIERQAGSLKRMLGDAAYSTLLWETERL